jgi:hypothetical protein
LGTRQIREIVLVSLQRGGSSRALDPSVEWSDHQVVDEATDNSQNHEKCGNDAEQAPSVKFLFLGCVGLWLLRGQVGLIGFGLDVLHQVEL